MSPQKFDFVDWWSKEEPRGGGTPVIVKMEHPNYSLLEIESPHHLDPKEKEKNAKQLTWVLLLQAHKAAGCVAWVGSGVMLLLAAIKKRLILGQGLARLRPPKGKLVKAITAFLVFAVVMLCVEVGAHAVGWQTARPSSFRVRVKELPNAVYVGWIYFRAGFLAPPLQTLTSFCIWLFLLQSVDLTVLTVLGYVYIKWKDIKPVPVNASLESEDVENPDSGHPMVLVQIPMCNEREVYEQSISAVCQLDWPPSRILIQVLDDSSDVEIRFLIQGEVSKWRQRGVNIVYRHRMQRTGFKAGNLKSAMECEYVKGYEFVTIFDADFQPKSDFLKRTVPHFRDNPELALVQARWSFVNKNENLLTRLQNMNLTFHFEVEQQVNGIFLNFFGFNGTAGVWRIKALEESGGWLERTTVEDMDIAVRAHLLGWKFVFLNDVRCMCELPGSYEAYRKQQHRWHSGPMQLFRLSIADIIKAKISCAKKANLIFLFFLLRKLILPFYSFTLFCIILPMVMFVPEATLPLWVVCYIPMFMSFLKVLPSLNSFPFLIPYLLFENTMSVTKFNAMVSGLFELSSAHEWVVTKKTGRSSSEADLLDMETMEELEEEVAEELEEEEEEEEAIAKPTRGLEKTRSMSGLDALKTHDHVQFKTLLPPSALIHTHPAPSRRNRLYRKELLLAFLLLAASARSLLSAHGLHFYFLLFQGVSFLVVGLDLIGEQVS